MQSSSAVLKTERPQIRKPAGRGDFDSKDITLKTLAQLKAKLYANAKCAMKQNPSKADIIQKAVDRDASRLAFAINMVHVKM